MVSNGITNNYTVYTGMKITTGILRNMASFYGKYTGSYGLFSTVYRHERFNAGIPCNDQLETWYKKWFTVVGYGEKK